MINELSNNNPSLASILLTFLRNDRWLMIYMRFGVNEPRYLVSVSLSLSLIFLIRISPFFLCLDIRYLIKIFNRSIVLMGKFVDDLQLSSLGCCLWTVDRDFEVTWLFFGQCLDKKNLFHVLEIGYEYVLFNHEFGNELTPISCLKCRKTRWIVVSISESFIYFLSPMACLTLFPFIRAITVLSDKSIYFSVCSHAFDPSCLSLSRDT